MRRSWTVCCLCAVPWFIIIAGCLLLRVFWGLFFNCVNFPDRSPGAEKSRPLRMFYLSDCIVSCIHLSQLSLGAGRGEMWGFEGEVRGVREWEGASSNKNPDLIRGRLHSIGLSVTNGSAEIQQPWLGRHWTRQKENPHISMYFIF